MHESSPIQDSSVSPFAMFGGSGSGRKNREDRDRGGSGSTYRSARGGSVASNSPGTGRSIGAETAHFNTIYSFRASHEMGEGLHPGGLHTGGLFAAASMSEHSREMMKNPCDFLKQKVVAVEENEGLKSALKRGRPLFEGTEKRVKF